MKTPMVSVTEQIEFEGFAFYHFIFRDIADVDSAKIRLGSDGAKACKFLAF